MFLGGWESAVCCIGRLWDHGALFESLQTEESGCSHLGNCRCWSSAEGCSSSGWTCGWSWAGMQLWKKVTKGRGAERDDPSLTDVTGVVNGCYIWVLVSFHLTAGNVLLFWLVCVKSFTGWKEEGASGDAHVASALRGFLDDLTRLFPALCFYLLSTGVPSIKAVECCWN